MNNLLAALVATLFACSVSLAQTAAPAAPATSTDAKAKQEIVQSTTQSAVSTTGSQATAKQQAKNTTASKKVPKKHTEVKSAATYGQSGPGSAAQAEKNTAISKKMPKQSVNLGTPAADAAMQKAANP